jgi:hypothetical protein
MEENLITGNRLSKTVRPRCRKGRAAGREYRRG